MLDHRLERPSFGEEQFLRIEGQRVGECNLAWPDLPQHYARICSTLNEFQTVLGDRLLVALLPDQYQVDDALWQTLVARSGAQAVLDREHPQKELLACCSRFRIQVLDLLPPLREAQRHGPTYHLRDTHWNAAGNNVAGEAIATWILAHRFAGVRPN